MQYHAALIGCGRMGATIDDEVADRPNSERWIPFSHAAAAVACERTDLIAVSDVFEEKAESIRDRYDVPVCYTDFREMIDKESPDIVCVATRPATHEEIVVHAAEVGVRGIYCEKPLCCSMAEADRMVDAVERYGVKFNYGTQRRFAPAYKLMRKLIDDGELGDIEAVIVQQGVGSALWGLTHGADMMQFLARDSDIEFVQGAIAVEEGNWDGNRLNIDPGIVSGFVQFEGGARGYFTAGTGTEFEVSGSEGKLRTFDDGVTISLRKEVEGGYPMATEPFPDYQLESGTPHGIRDIAEALDEDRETQGPIQLARASQEMLMGFIESHRLGGKRVSIPMENRDLYVGRENW